MNGMDGLDLAKVLGLKGGCWVGVGGGLEGRSPETITLTIRLKMGVVGGRT